MTVRTANDEGVFDIFFGKWDVVCVYLIEA